MCRATEHTILECSLIVCHCSSAMLSNDNISTSTGPGGRFGRNYKLSFIFQL